MSNAPERHMRELLSALVVHEVAALPFPPHRLSFARLRRAATRTLQRRCLR